MIDNYKGVSTFITANPSTNFDNLVKVTDRVADFLSKIV